MTIEDVDTMICSDGREGRRKTCREQATIVITPLNAPRGGISSFCAQHAIRHCEMMIAYGIDFNVERVA
jgi:hypothetical protein